MTNTSHLEGSSNSLKPPLVILFKTPPSSLTSVNPPDPHQIQQDPYTTHLHPFETRYIPLLSDTYVNLNSLSEIIKEGSERWEAVLMTSKRAAESWVEGCRHLPVDGDIQGGAGRGWDEVGVWSPGPSVGEVLTSSGLGRGLIPRLMWGDDTGNKIPKSAATLLPVILSTPPRRRLSPPSGESYTQPSGGLSVRQKGYLPYLFLTGDKTLPDLPDGLEASGRAITKVQVYETAPLPDIPAKLEPLIDEKDERDIWLVFFSPSSAGIAIPHLRILDLIPASSSSLNKVHHSDKVNETTARHMHRVRIAAIGETTRRYLLEQGVEVEVVAKTPTPEGVADAIKGYYLTSQG